MQAAAHILVLMAKSDGIEIPSLLQTLSYSLDDYMQELSSLVSSSHKAALIYDGVHLFSRAVENLITETDLTTPQVGCDNKDSPYDLGDRLLQEINSVSAYLMITLCDIL